MNILNRKMTNLIIEAYGKHLIKPRAGLFKEVRENFDFGFVISVLMRCSVYIVCPTVLSCGNLKLHQTLEIETFLYKKK